MSSNTLPLTPSTITTTTKVNVPTLVYQAPSIKSENNTVTSAATINSVSQPLPPLLPPPPSCTQHTIQPPSFIVATVPAISVNVEKVDITTNYNSTFNVIPTVATGITKLSSASPIDEPRETEFIRTTIYNSHNYYNNQRGINIINDSLQHHQANNSSKNDVNGVEIAVNATVKTEDVTEDLVQYGRSIINGKIETCI